MTTTETLETNTVEQQVLDSLEELALANTYELFNIEGEAEKLLSGRELIETDHQVESDHYAQLGQEIARMLTHNKAIPDIFRLKLDLTSLLQSLAGRTALVSSLDGSEVLEVREFRRLRYEDGRAWLPITPISSTSAVIPSDAYYPYLYKNDRTIRLAFPKRRMKPSRELMFEAVNERGNPFVNLHIL